MSEWITVCTLDDIDEEDVLRFDHAGRTYAVYHSPEGDYFATDGLCTHEKIHLADGLVMDHTIECPKHHGTFDYRTGEALAPPVCVNLRCYPVRTTGNEVQMEIPD